MTDNDPPNDGDGIAAAEGNIPAPQESDFVEYSIEDKPPLLESILLGFQHYLTMIGSTIAIPLVLSSGRYRVRAGPCPRRPRRN